MRVPLERKVLNENDRIAATLRERFQRNGTFCLNLISSPGSGKTLLLERTVKILGPEFKMAILTGDQEEDGRGDQERAKCHTPTVSTHSSAGQRGTRSLLRSACFYG